MEPKNIVLALAALGVAFWYLMGMKEEANAPADHEVAAVKTIGTNVKSKAAVSLVDERPLPEDPAQLAYVGEFGFSAGQQGLMAANETMYFVKDAVTPETYPYLTEKYPVPRDFHILPNAEACAPRPLGQDEELANAFIYIPPTQNSSGLHAISLNRLTEYSLKWMRSARLRRDATFSNVRARLRTERSNYGGVAWAPMETVNVYVGRTEKPVYVLLQAGTPRVLFNVIAADDAQIAHVQVVSNGTSAVALPETVGSLDILDVTKTDCGWQPVQEPQSNWGALTGSEQIGEDQVTRHYKRYFAYSGWFRDFYGQDPKKDVIGGDTGYHLLVGHMPAEDEPRFSHRPLSQSVVYISDEEVIIAGTDDQVALAVQSMQVDMVAQFLDGDVSRLVPPNVPAELPAPITPQLQQTAQINHDPSQLMETAR